jgi:hypothetical protein
LLIFPARQLDLSGKRTFDLSDYRRINSWTCFVQALPKVVPLIVQVGDANGRSVGYEKAIAKSVAREAIPQNGSNSGYRAPPDRLAGPEPEPAPLMNNESVFGDLDVLTGCLHFSAKVQVILRLTEDALRLLG